MHPYPFKISHVIDNQYLKSESSIQDFYYYFIINDLPLIFDGEFHGWFHK